MKVREKEIFTNRGITLVALIITIIILLILAGVSLSFVFNGGILDKSQEAVNEYQNAANNESDVLEYINETLDKKLNEIGGGPEETPNVDENGLATEDTTITTDDPNVQIVIPEGFAPAILMTGTTQSSPGENGAVKEIIPASDWNSITKEQINKGIVVVDNKITYDNGQLSGTVPNFNEYVWVPIVDSSKFKRVAWNGPYYDTEYHSTGTHPLSDDSAENKYWEDTTSSEYAKMVSSVSSNKGFYISRYEASQKDSTTAQSKRGQNSWNYISQLDAITASSNMNPSINSHLVYGIEWDSVLSWLNQSAIISSTEKGKTKTMELADIQTDSRSWGNFYNSTGDAVTNSNKIQPSGASEYWKANNIYDLAGNLWKLTQERYSYENLIGYRGGDYNKNGNSDILTVANRFQCENTWTNSNDLRF